MIKRCYDSTWWCFHRYGGRGITVCDLWRDDFAAFVSDVLADFAERGGSCEWENGTLDRFLDGMAAFAAARLQGGADQEKPTWKLFAEIIAAGTAYE